MSNAAKLASYGLTKEEREITKGIMASFTDTVKDEFVQKTTFSPSRLSWSSGECPRRNWFLFKGVIEKEIVSAFSKENMQNGTDAHERMQDQIEVGPLNVEIEKQLRCQDPPINSFCDVVVNLPDKKVPIEIKTAKEVAFEYRQSSKTAAKYHVFQLLIYMWLLDTDLGFIMYENKNNYEKLMIPVHMNAENRETVEAAIEWMRLVYKAYEEDKMPKFFKGKRSNSKICKDCPVKEACDAAGEGEVDIPLLTKYERGTNE